MSTMTPAYLRRALFSIVLIVSGVAALFAAGSSEEYPFEPVSGESHWSYTVNLEDKEEGKHNLVIRSVDEAGNIRYEGPYDFHVDPATDIPSVAVAHPQPGARVGRMLPIIGTARDDDGVDRVEVSINDGSWRPAAGAEAWSAVLDAGALGDGPHTISVRSIDVNGIESPAVIVPFIVDTSAPVGGVIEPISGALISGKTSFSGVLEDPNGVELLEISRDGGDSWDSLRFSKNKETGAADFSVDLDSRDLEDGPVVWWFRAVDTQGSLSEVPFLFFVDNQGPVVNLELPLNREDGFEPVPGNVFLAGTATDQSGIESLRIIVGKSEPVEIPVTPGNPWWTWPLNLSGMKDKQANVLIVAADGAGN
ncbi:MAG: Ig-like domain-containing protein, partial [Spirochaetaceae bacterium]|nr:Ig-like domain-containing protein [Spirochaetaceae bacterium]